jgi:hypothetical protein
MGTSRILLHSHPLKFSSRVTRRLGTHKSAADIDEDSQDIARDVLLRVARGCYHDIAHCPSASGQRCITIGLGLGSLRHVTSGSRNVAEVLHNIALQGSHLSVFLKCCMHCVWRLRRILSFPDSIQTWVATIIKALFHTSRVLVKYFVPVF